MNYYSSLALFHSTSASCLPPLTPNRPPLRGHLMFGVSLYCCWGLTLQYKVPVQKQISPRYKLFERGCVVSNIPSTADRCLNAAVNV